MLEDFDSTEIGFLTAAGDVEDETREWLDSDQVTVVPSPDDL